MKYDAYRVCHNPEKGTAVFLGVVDSPGGSRCGYTFDVGQPLDHQKLPEVELLYSVLELRNKLLEKSGYNIADGQHIWTLAWMAMEILRQRDYAKEIAAFAMPCGNA